MEYNIAGVITQHLNKATCLNRLAKYWSTFAKSHDVPINIFDDEGNTADTWLEVDDIDDVDESNLIDYLLQPQYAQLDSGTYSNVGNEYVVKITLGDLFTAFENEDLYKLRQFDVAPARVSKIADEIIKHRRLLEPIELAYVSNEPIDDLEELDFSSYNPVILSGRHRGMALFTIFSPVRYSEELQLFVKLRRFDTEAELAMHIHTRNGSRAMTATEVNGLWFAEQGVNPNDTDDIFDSVSKGLTVLPKVFEVYFLNVLDSDKLGITPATCGTLGKKIAVKLKGKGLLDAKVRKFLKDPETAKRIAETAVDAISDESNWEALKSACKIEQVDTEGNKVVSINVSRNIDKVANPIAKQLAIAFKTELEDALVQSEAQREARARKRKESAAERESRRLSEAVKTLESLGIKVDIDEEKVLAKV